MTYAANDQRDFFVSFTQADRAWATWIAWVLEEAGYSVFFQDWDFRGSFVEEMHQASLRSARTLVVLSENYLRSKYARSEAWAALARDPVGRNDRIVTIKVGPSDDLGLFAHFDHLDLGSKAEADAERLLSERVKKSLDPTYRSKPQTRPRFPGHATSKPTFPPPATGPMLAGNSLPPRGRFVGRATDLDQLRAWILDPARRPIVVLGPGGIGKSKLTVAALHDAALAPRFAHRLFVRLDDVRDEAGVYAAVARELGVPPGPQPFASLVATLTGQSALLALDNAESPWQADLPGAEQAFARLAELPGVTLVASLRGNEVPGLADWRSILVEPLALDPARALFLAIAGDHFAADPDLSTLLARLDGLPLAIELIAHRAQADPDLATVLRRWDEEKSDFIRRGQDGRKDLDLAVSIALSLSSPRMTDSGRRLFALLGRLPHGLAAIDLTAVMPDGGDAAAATLRATGLVLRDTKRLRMLAPVREYAYRIALSDLDQSILYHHYLFLAFELSRYFDGSNRAVDLSRLGAELVNIQAVLPRNEYDMLIGDVVGRSNLVGVEFALAASELFSAIDRWLEEAAIKIDELYPERGRPVQSYPSNGLDTISELKDEALRGFTDYQAFAERRAAADPDNAQWQRDLIVSHDKLAGLLEQLPDRVMEVESALVEHHATAEAAVPPP